MALGLNNVNKPPLVANELMPYKDWFKNTYNWTPKTGTWTPFILGTVTMPTVTYSLQGGVWTRYGNVVHVTGVMQISVLTAAGAGNFYIGGLPYLPSPDEVNRGGGFVFFATGWNQNAPYSVMARLSEPFLQSFKKNSTDVRDNVSAQPVTDWAAGCRMNFNATYYTNDPIA